MTKNNDIIYLNTQGRDVMQSGATYMIEANKNVSVQYGALWGNERDGGGYVPSSNGSASGELFYFAVPYQAAGEQEIRVSSWDSNNQVQLSRYSGGQWIAMSSWTLNQYQPADWVGKQNGNATYATLFRVTCTAGKRVSVMEANWMETGATNTSDMSTMLSAENGTCSGKKYLAYMLPPSTEGNVYDPFTNQLFTGSISHFYLFAGGQSTTVTIKDAKTNGAVLNKTYNIAADRYADAKFTITEWKSIYNGTGTAAGGSERPYVLIESSQNISVLSTNFNDNWMNYFGSSLPQSFKLGAASSSPDAIPGQQVTFTTSLTQDNVTITGTSMEVNVGSGLLPISSVLYNNGQQVQTGTITTTSDGSLITFQDISTITATDNYQMQTTVLVKSTYDNGTVIPNGVILSTETVVSGTVNGEFQQAFVSKGIQNNTANTANLLFSACHQTTVGSTVNDAWNAAWVDYNNDGWEDLCVATKSETQANELYRNNGNGTFTKITNINFVNEKALTTASVWADINNDGRMDVLLVNSSKTRSKLFLNNGNSNFTELKNSGIDTNPEYFHGAAFADFDNDGFVDLVMTNFFQTRFHQLYRNNGNNTFSRVENTPVTQETERSLAPILADYNNDGLVDIFIPNGNNRPNSLFKNVGNFQFQKVNDATLAADAKNSVGAAWGDLNNDGFLDLVVVNASKQTNDLYLNVQGQSFMKVQNSLFAEYNGDNHGVVCADLDNDGWTDIFMTNDNGLSMLYLNDHNGGFTLKPEELIAGSLGKAYGVAYGDYNKDGALDLVVTTHTTGTTGFYCHNPSTNNWIGFKLQGVYSNKAAIGAQVAIKANGVWQYRQLLPVSGFGSQNTTLIHFGLAATSQVDSVRVLWPSGIKQYVTGYSSGTYNAVQEQGGTVVMGKAFNDLNGNGVQNAGENTVGNLGLNIDPTGISLRTDEAGTFQLYTRESSLQFSLNNTSYWSLNQNFATINNTNPNDTLWANVPVQAVTNGYDLAVSFATTAWRRGFENQTVLVVQNLGTTAAGSAQVKLTYPNNVYLKTADANYSVSGKEYTWQIGTLEAGASRTFLITDSVGLGLATGNSVTLTANTSASGLDVNAANNTAQEDITIVGAIDPNDISVSPKGKGSLGYVNPDQVLTYTIRFENSGTYKATYVVLESQLPAGLDFNTFQVVGASHHYTYSLDRDGNLNVSFSHIDLPTVYDNPTAAHGYFKYQIKPKNNLAGDTRLLNQANITFDFEAPIATNIVQNTIRFKGSNAVKSLILYPNPATDEVTLVLDKAHESVTEPQVILQWQVMDLLGRVKMEAYGLSQPEAQVRVANLEKGVYLLKAWDQYGVLYIGQLTKQ
ncbi:FG-GAP-like repeat-containing protein [Flexibacter flexilis]|nr:FG-GAP-like repeat-containing protein [Flexibacter flexilis]